MLRRQLRALTEARDPAGMNFDPEAPPVVCRAGNALVEANLNAR